MLPHNDSTHGSPVLRSARVVPVWHVDRRWDGSNVPDQRSRSDSNSTVTAEPAEAQKPVDTPPRALHHPPPSPPPPAPVSPPTELSGVPDLPSIDIPARSSSWNRASVGSDPPLRSIGQKPSKILEETYKALSAETTVPPPPKMSTGTTDSDALSYLTEDTRATSVGLAPLQAKEDYNHLHPVEAHEDDPASYDLVAPPSEEELPNRAFSLERRSEQLFSREHLQAIFSEPSTLLRFSAFLSSQRPQSIPILVYYLDALKALKAIAYSNAIADGLEPLSGHTFTEGQAARTGNTALEEKASKAFDLMVEQDLPGYVTHVYTTVVQESISRRITGTLPAHLREASEGLAEVFCLTDPSREDNPIIFASEEFHRTTQYGVDYAIGRNCRFLQGPKTSKFSVQRLRETLEQGKEHSEVFLNYRRDGSTFMNLLTMAPLRDSRGGIRYFIGAQVDVSGLVRDCSELPSLNKLLQEEKSKTEAERKRAQAGVSNDPEETSAHTKDEFQELAEMLNQSELDTVRQHGGRLHSDAPPLEDISDSSEATHRPRLLLKEASDQELTPPLSPVTPTGNADPSMSPASPSAGLPASGRLAGLYQNYLLLRPAPSLRILFASPSLRIPGILQTPFLSRIGGSSRVRDELEAALHAGRGVTARVKWLNKFSDTTGVGRTRWVHCTPLLGGNGRVGVWMVVLVDPLGGESEKRKGKGRTAPMVSSQEVLRGSLRKAEGVDGESLRSGRSGYSVELR